MKPKAALIAAMILLLVAAAFWLVSTSRAATETPDYKTVRTDGKPEIRDCPRPADELAATGKRRGVTSLYANWREMLAKEKTGIVGIGPRSPRWVSAHPAAGDREVTMADKREGREPVGPIARISAAVMIRNHPGRVRVAPRRWHASAYPARRSAASARRMKRTAFTPAARAGIQP